MGDTSLDGDKQQGLRMIIREEKWENINVISWRSRQSERKAWSTLSGEARVMQHAIDKATHLNLKALADEIGRELNKTTILTDKLSLRRVIQSGRPTQEQGLRRDLAIIRDQIVHNDMNIRFMKSMAMIADHLAKERSGEQIYEMLRHSKFERIEKYDNNEVTAANIREAAIDIPVLEDPVILHVDVDTLYEVIGQDAEELSSSASDSSVHEGELTSGSKSRIVETSDQTSMDHDEDQQANRR